MNTEQLIAEFAKVLDAAPTERTIPHDWQRSHWRRFESNQEHAERVERAEHEAGRYFADATKAQRAVWDRAMLDLRGLDAPRYTRARAAANAVWERTTREAADLLTITADAIMFHGECPEEISSLWDDLEAREAAARSVAA